MKKMICSLILAASMIINSPFTALTANPWSNTNGQYVDTQGNIIEGVVERGISVSKYQGEIDWASVAEDDIAFAMVRIGYLESLDPTFDYNMRQAAANGVQTGVYLYSQALTVEKAIAEAEFTVRVCKDYEISYPIAMDLESEYISGLSRQEMTDIANAFCKVVEEAGFHPVVYGYNKWLVEKMDTQQIPYDIWYARYGSINEYPNRTIWQCTAEGIVEGISEKVCLELSFRDYSTIIPSQGFKRIAGQNYYYVDHKMQKGWAQVGESWYYLHPVDGHMVTDSVLNIDGVNYQFGPDGIWID